MMAHRIKWKLISKRWGETKTETHDRSLAEAVNSRAAVWRVTTRGRQKVRIVRELPHPHLPAHKVSPRNQFSFYYLNMGLEVLDNIPQVDHLSQYQTRYNTLVVKSDSEPSVTEHNAGLGHLTTRHFLFLSVCLLLLIDFLFSLLSSADWRKKQASFNKTEK